MDFISLSNECAPGVAPQTMAAIVRAESAFNPLAIGINGGYRLTRQPVDQAEAINVASQLISSGYNIDLGLGQINYRNLLRIGLTLHDAFDACKNLRAAAGMLRGHYQRARKQNFDPQSSLRLALSAYNTGTFNRGFSNGYVQRVVKNASATGGRDRPSDKNHRPVDVERTEKARDKPSQFVWSSELYQDPAESQAMIYSQEPAYVFHIDARGVKY